MAVEFTNSQSKEGKPEHKAAWVFVNVFVLFPVHGFVTEEQFEDFVKTDPRSGKVLAAVVFKNTFIHDDDPLPLEVKFGVENGGDCSCSVSVYG